MINIKGLGLLERVEIPAINRTGAALVVGGVYALDLTQSNAASTDADSSLSNVVACATANIRGMLVVALQATADKAQGRFLFKGYGQVLVDGTTAVAAGDRLIPQNASPNLIKQAATSLVNPAGFALGAQATAAGTPTPMYFNGETWKGEKAVS